MDLGLENKGFIVTGGAKGIGKAIATLIAEEKGIPVIVDKDTLAGNRLVKELTSKSLKAFFVETDLTDADQCHICVDQSVSLVGELHGLVNNAGINDGVGLENGTPEKFQKSLEKNLNHYYNMAHFCLKHLQTTKGSIVNVASKTAVTGQGGTSGYAASKGGVLALTREWAVELAPLGIRSNAIVPAEVMTPLYESWLSTFEHPEQKLHSILQKIPLGQRMTTAEEIAAMAVFLLSSKSAHTTGQWQFVDGGYVHLDRAVT